MAIHMYDQGYVDKRIFTKMHVLSILHLGYKIRISKHKTKKEMIRKFKDSIANNRTKLDVSASCYGVYVYPWDELPSLKDNDISQQKQSPNN